MFVEEESKRSATFRFWSSYIDMIGLLLRFIRATRSTNWDLHLDSLREMIPWYFAYDRINYSRYLCAYWLEMKALRISHPGKDYYITFVNFYVTTDKQV